MLFCKAGDSLVFICTCHKGLTQQLHCFAAELITYLPKAKSIQGINLLSGQDSSGNQSTHQEQAELAAVPREYISYLKPNLTIAMVDDFTKYQRTGIPPIVSVIILSTLC